jgi:hypothetical protein
MNPLVKFSFLLLLAIGLAACKSSPPPAPGDSVFSGSETTAYRRGYHFGFDDGKANQSDDFERYYEHYKADTKSAFQKGYAKGFEAGNDKAQATPQSEIDSFRQGFEMGKADSLNEQPPNYKSHASVFTDATEGDFHRGYVEGYKAARQQ